MPMNNLIGIVTVLYNSEAVVDDFFASLVRQDDVRYKLYIVDNSATPAALDHCRRLAQQHHIDAEFLFNGANLGVAKGNNQGIEMARRDGCPYILLANNDTDFASGTLSALLKPLQSGDAVATPKMLYHGPENLVWYAGGRIDAWTMRTPHIGQRCVDAGQFDTPGETGYAPTCFLLLKADVFEQVGTMDESYFVYYDDTDFVWRLIQAGLKIRYVPQSVVLHKVSTSTGGERSPFTLYYANRNRIYFIRKNFKGVRKAFALSYVLVTRLVNASRMSRAQAGRLWAGVRDGLRMPVNADAS